MLAEPLEFGVLQETVTPCINANKQIYCEKVDVFVRINNNRYKGNFMGFLAYETSLYSVKSTKISKHRLLKAVKEDKFNS
jgi:hypothetical protein